MEMLYTLVGVILGGILGVVLWESRKHKIDNLTVILLLVGLILVLFSICAPILFTQYSSPIHFDENTGVIGDTIGGIMNPFISIAAVIVMGLAFYAQYRANDMVRKQFELQKFENQFYEMLRLHKENVNEMEIGRKDGKGIIKGREVFFEMKKEILVALCVVGCKIKRVEDIGKVYKIFFWGINPKSDDEIEKKLLKDIQDLKVYNENKGEKVDIELELKMMVGLLGKIENDCKINFLEGHHSFLGHYYRHLFHTVKFVVNQKNDLVSEEQKINYLRVLRAQLSNDEQEMLFYNWLSGYGKDWENDTNHFFTKYKMIHNLWYTDLCKDNIIKEKLQYLVDKYKKIGGRGNLFEIGDNIK